MVSVLPVGRNAVVVVRVWLEPDHERSLRARITATDLATKEEMTALAASVDEIVEIVRAWVDSFLRPGDGGVTSQ